MARSIATIKQQIIDSKNNDPVLGTKLTSTSQTAIWNLWIYITAVAINLHEQLWDVFKQEIEDIAAGIAPGTPAWLRGKVLEFQFSAEETQQLQMVNFVPQYIPIVPELRIIARCAVKQQSDRRVLVKVAKENGNYLGPLTNEELNALKSYVDNIKFAGTAVGVISLDADRLQVYVTVYYDGQFVESTVKKNVIEAITNYLANLPFDGVLYNTRLIDAIQAVPGVKDVAFNSNGVRTRVATLSAGSANVITRVYETEAGYIIPEDVTDYTLEQTIIMSPAS